MELHCPNRFPRHTPFAFDVPFGRTSTIPAIATVMEALQIGWTPLLLLMPQLSVLENGCVSQKHNTT
jgi:hypothetical protein